MPGSGGGSRRPSGETPGPGLSRIPGKNSTEPGGGAPPGPLSWNAWPGFPRLPVLRILVNANPIRPVARVFPGGTTEVSSHETGLVSRKAGATERRKVWGNSAVIGTTKRQSPEHLKKFFVTVVGFIGLGGSLKNGFQLVHSFYLWPLLRFVGYGALLAWALLMPGRARYNTRSLSN